MALWRDAGLTYLRYSQVAAAALKSCIKKTPADVAKKPSTLLKVTPWENGKPIKAQ